MSNEIPKHRPHLATLAEAINILRDALRDFFISRISKDSILKELETVFERRNPALVERKEFEKCKQGKTDIRDVLDINIISQSKLINKTQLHDKSDFYREMRRMVMYRNKVCHPSFKDISRDDLENCLESIYNLLFLMKKRKEAHVIDMLRKNPYTASHYNYHIARNNPETQEDRKEDKGQKLKEITKHRDEAVEAWQQSAIALQRTEQERDSAKVQAQHSQQQLIQAKQAKEKESQASKLRQKALENERDRAIVEKQQVTAALQRTEQERDSAKVQAQHSQQQLIQAKQAKEKESQASKLKQKALENERDRAIVEKQQVTATQERVVGERDKKVKLYRRTTFSLSALAFFAVLLSFLLNFQQREENTRQMDTANVLQEPTPNSASILSPTVAPNLEPGSTPSPLPTTIPAIVVPTVMHTPMPTATLRPSPTVAPTATLTPLPSVSIDEESEVTTEVRMYAGPGIEFEVKGEILQAGTTVEVLGIDSSGDWYVLANRYWIPALAVRFAPDDLAVTSAPYVLTGANLRAEPTTNSPVQGGVSAGSIIVIVGQKEGGPPTGTWYQLDSGLWIYGELIAGVPPNLPVLP